VNKFIESSIKCKQLNKKYMNFLKESKEYFNSINLNDINKGDVVKFILPGTTNTVVNGTVVGFQSTRVEKFIVVRTKNRTINVSVNNIGGIVKKSKRPVSEGADPSVLEKIHALKDIVNTNKNYINRSQYSNLIKSLDDLQIQFNSLKF